MRFRVFALVSMVVSGLLLLARGAVKTLYPSWPDMLTLECYLLFFLSIVFLACTVIWPRRWAELASILEDEFERVVVDTVTCLGCSGCGHVLKRAWLRGDYIGKVTGRCLLCESEYRVKVIYAV